MITSGKNKFLKGAIALIAILALALLFLNAPLSFARAVTDKELVLERSFVTTATPAHDNVYRSISKGDTVTVTYSLVKNEGMLESLWTPKYDDRFELTSFIVNEDWTLFNSYPYQTQSGYEFRTATEQIAAFNAARRAGEDFPYECLSFSIYTNEANATSVVSDFITITYTALDDFAAPVAGPSSFAFGFSNDADKTQAAASGNALMDLFFKTGETGSGDPIYSSIGRSDVILRVLAPTTVVFDDQQVLLVSGVLPLDAIQWEIKTPATVAGVNPYVQDGGSVSYRFYTADPALGGELIQNQSGDPIVPTAVGTYYTIAIFAETAHYEGKQCAAILTVVDRTLYDFVFRAALSGDLANEKLLVWDGSRFNFADEAQSFGFDMNTPIPKADSIRSFRIQKWLKVTEGVGGEKNYETVVLFEKEQSVDLNAEAYYLAEMTYDVGAGDVNGDGLVNIDDVLTMKRAFVSPEAMTEVATPAEAWALTEQTNRTKLLFLSARDVNADGSFDARDIVYTLEAIATGYSYAVKSGVTADGAFVSGDRVILDAAEAHEGEVVAATSVQKVQEVISDNKVVLLLADIDASDQDVTLSFAGDVVIDLGGKAFSARSFKITAGGSFVIKNGSIAYDSVLIKTKDGIFVKNIEGIEDINGEINRLEE